MLCWHWLPTNLAKGSNLPLPFHAMHKRFFPILRAFTRQVGLWRNSLMKNRNPLFFGVGERA